MTLRARFASAVLERVKAHAPDASQTVWDVDAAVCVIENLKFSYCDECFDTYEMAGGFEGILRVELHADRIDAIDFMPFVSDVLAKPIIIPNILSDDVERCEMARAVLIEQRDAVRDVNEVLAAFRFEIHGSIIRRIDPAATPKLHISLAPEIGEAHRDKYAEIGGDADE